MPKITKIDRPSVRQINDRVKTTLKALGDELGLVFTTDTVKFSDGPHGSLKLSFSCASSDGTVQTADEVLFRQLARIHGFQPDDYGAHLRYKGILYKIQKIRTKAPAYPIGTVPVSGSGPGLNLPAGAALALVNQHRAQRAATIAAGRMVAEVQAQ